VREKSSHLYTGFQSRVTPVGATALQCAGEWLCQSRVAVNRPRNIKFLQPPLRVLRKALFPAQHFLAGSAAEK
jgi:hypothetical protein